MTDDNLQTDPRLEFLMQWLKDNDESGLSKDEHANHSGTRAPEKIEIPDYD